MLHLLHLTRKGENIWIAASDGDLERVRELLGYKDADVNVRDSNGYSPLHAAVSYTHIGLVAYLLSCGADVNLRDSDGDTPLFACESPECAQLLIQAGADILAKNFEGKMAVDVAEEDERTDVVAFLRSFPGVPPALPSFVPADRCEEGELDEITEVAHDSEEEEESEEEVRAALRLEMLLRAGMGFSPRRS